MIAAVYGQQALVFIIKREFMLVGWMVVYRLSYVTAFHLFSYLLIPCRYPVYSFFLPIYSFWCMDDFSWGNTRLVIGEGSNKKVIVNDDDKYDESMIPLKRYGFL
jgi:chitin synthase